MSEKTEKKVSRRTLVTALAAGGGLASGAAMMPESWKKPVVTALYIPAHAQTTDSGGEPGAGTTVAPVMTTEPPMTTEPAVMTTQPPIGPTGTILVNNVDE